jgi:hypothetical protein
MPFPVFNAVPDADGLAHVAEREVNPERVRGSTHGLFLASAQGDLFDRIVERSVRLGDLADVNFGKQLRDRRVHTRDVIEVANIAAVPVSYRPCYTGQDVLPWIVKWTGLAALNREEARRGGCWDSDKQDATNKLITRQIGKFPVFAIDLLGYQCLNTMFTVNITTSNLSPYFVLGALNSTVVKAFWLERFWDQRRTFPKIKGTYLKELPIPRLDLSKR